MTSETIIEWALVALISVLTAAMIALLIRFIQLLWDDERDSE